MLIIIGEYYSNYFILGNLDFLKQIGMGQQQTKWYYDRLGESMPNNNR